MAEEKKELTGYPSVDRPWLKYYSEEAINAAIPKLSMVQYMMRCNAGRLNATAAELRSSKNDFAKGIGITYNQFFKQIMKNACAFKKIGVSPKDNVALILPNILESRISIYGLNILGAVSCPINFMISANELKQKLEDYNVRVLIIFSGFYDKFKNVLESSTNLQKIIVVYGYETFPLAVKMMAKFKTKATISLRDERLITYESFIAKGKGVCDFYFEENQTAVIVGTSGTTGTPKGVCLTNENINAIGIQHLGTKTFLPTDKILDILIQSIGYGVSAMHFSHCGGMHCVMIPELITDRIGHVIDRIRPDHITAGPVHVQSFAESSEFKEREYYNLKNFACGGASLGHFLEARVNSVEDGYYENGIKNPKIIVRQGLGATENGGCGTYAIWGQYKFGGVGVPLPLDTFAVFDYSTGAELPYDTLGELCISGPTVMKEYYNNPEETNLVLKEHDDGRIWLHLGDTGYIDKDGQIFHVDRKKNIFMRTGFNVHPAKIADFIKTLPGVVDCAVIGYEHPTQQMVPVAFVKLKEQIPVDNLENVIGEIHRQCVDNLEETSIPERIIVVKTIPYNIGGKVQSEVIKNNYSIKFKS